MLCVELGAYGHSFFPGKCNLRKCDESLHVVSGHVGGVAVAAPLPEQSVWPEEWEGYEGAAYCFPGLESSLGSAAACPICPGTSLGS